MRARLRSCLAGLVLCVSTPAFADETDNFTCRSRLTSDAGPVLDRWLNGHIQDVLARVNRREPTCTDCVVRDLQKTIGASRPERLTFVPHARFEQWVRGQHDVDRCHLRFGETIYGRRAYNLPWLLPFNRRIIFVADSIRLYGQTVGIDKLSHFIREGLSHWRNVQQGRKLEDLVREELGTPGWQLGWNEHGLKGMSLTGVVAYADIAAGYSGFRFWTDLLSMDRPGSLVAYDTARGRFVQTRLATLAAYVNQTWDESFNYSDFDPALDRQVATALERRSMIRHLDNCRALALLPDAQLYVNPRCLAADVVQRAGRQ